MRGLIEETINVTFTTGYYAITDGIEDYFLSFVEDGTTNMISWRVLDEMVNQSLERWSCSEVSIEALINRSVINSSFTESIATFEKQRATEAIEKNLKSDAKVRKKIPSPPSRFFSKSAGIISNKEFKDKCLLHGCRNRKKIAYTATV